VLITLLLPSLSNQESFERLVLLGRLVEHASDRHRISSLEATFISIQANLHQTSRAGLSTLQQYHLPFAGPSKRANLKSSFVSHVIGAYVTEQNIEAGKRQIDCGPRGPFAAWAPPSCEADTSGGAKGLRSPNDCGRGGGGRRGGSIVE
jgi:hypothetical protein